MLVVVRAAWCVLRRTGLRRSRNTHYATRITFVLWIASLTVTFIGCRPTGPTPVEYVVPTAVRHTPTPIEPTLTVSPSPTTSPTPAPTLTPAQVVSSMLEPTRANVITQAGWNLFSLVLGGRVVTPTAGRDTVLWVAPAGPGLGLYLYNLRSDQAQLLTEPSTSGGCICRGYRSGDWVVMVETEPGATWWEMSALNLVTDEHIPIGRTDDPATQTVLRPGEFAINADGLAVWKEVTTTTDESVKETLHLYDPSTGETSDILTVRSPARIGQVAMYGEWVVWSQATGGQAGPRGDVFAYNIGSDTLFPVGETGRAWEPAIWGTTVVWKHADSPFADGDVSLFNLGTGGGRLLTKSGQVSEVGIGDGFVVWSSASAGTVVLHDLETGLNKVVSQGGVVRLAAGENTVVWLLDDEPGTLHIAWKREM